jgi:UDP-N-acetylglucosamine 2-epimerase (non-hydrolysing)
VSILKVLNVVGARPNLMKMAPLVAEMARYPDIQQTLVHTGQHYDASLSQVFFDDLGLPRPDITLGVGSGTHAEQTARVMVGIEQVLAELRPDVVVVVGDVNSTLACAITAAKLWIPVAHVEAGLRSFDRTMPEEINRIVTDAVSDFLFTTSRDADANLEREGIEPDKIFFVGNTMIDTLQRHRQRAAALGMPQHMGLQPGEYALITLHRPSNVDDPDVFGGILDTLHAVQRCLPVLFPLHPRTASRLEEFGLLESLAAAPDLHCLEPQGYLAFLDLMMHARLVLTDSGGVQEETTILGVPCLTLRENTERPVTVLEGTNMLVGTDPQRILEAVDAVLAGEGKHGGIPELWDGRAAERIVAVLREELGQG